MEKHNKNGRPSGDGMSAKEAILPKDGRPPKDYLPLEEALARLCREVTPVSGLELVGLLEASGRILAMDMDAPMDNPPFDRSPVDGYALCGADTREASREHPACFKVVAEIDAGSYYPGTVQPGEAVRIMTGAPIPKGCDVCVRQEDTNYGEDRVEVYVPCRAGMNYCYAGEDFVKGQRMLAAGTKLGYVEISVLASMGVKEVPVYRRPRIALLTTGDELVFPGTPLAPGKIYNSNLFGLGARLRELGFAPTYIRQLPDDGPGAAKVVAEAAKTMDLILTTGGVSVGKKDIIHDVLNLAGARRLFWGIQIKPGMPTLASMVGGVPLISLTGNPFGALATFELLVRPVLSKLCRDDTLPAPKARAVFCGAFQKASPVRRFVRARYTPVDILAPGTDTAGAPEGTVTAPDADAMRAPGISGACGFVTLPEGSHSSGVLASMRGCNCLIDIPAGSSGLCEGTLVDVFLIE